MLSILAWPNLVVCLHMALHPVKLQNTLRRWERCAKGDSYIVNQAAWFSHCTTEVQRCIFDSIAVLQSEFVKGKLSSKTSEALSDLKDLNTFHQSISVVSGMSLQHRVDRLFVHQVIW